MPMSRRDKRIGALIHGYYVHALIGWGGSSKVYRACNYDTLTRVAVKIISKPRSRIGDLQRSFSECAVLAELKHPNIVRMVEWFESTKHVYIVTELARSGDLLTRINNADIPEATQKEWFAQLVDAVAYIHAAGFVHLDIKPDNVLLDGDSRVLLADWGFAQSYSRGGMCTTFRGTEGYWAPEIADRRPFFAPAADCWSLGVTLFALACRRLPFDRNSATYHDDLQKGNFSMPSELSLETRSMLYAFF